MSIKALVVRGTLRLYPARWRAEYGQELEGLLLLGRLTPRAIADVILSAIRERLRIEPAWKVCGSSVFALTVVGIFVNNTRPPSAEVFATYRCVLCFFVFMAGFLTAWRNPKASSALAGVKTSLLGYVPEIVTMCLWAIGTFHPLLTKVPGPYGFSEMRLALFSATAPDYAIRDAAGPALLLAIIAELAVLGVWGLLIGGIGGQVGRAVLFISDRFFQKPKLQ